MKVVALACLVLLSGCVEYTNKVITHGSNRYCNLPEIQRDYVYARAKVEMEKNGILIGSQIRCPSDRLEEAVVIAPPDVE